MVNPYRSGRVKNRKQAEDVVENLIIHDDIPPLIDCRALRTLAVRTKGIHGVRKAVIEAV